MTTKYHETNSEREQVFERLWNEVYHNLTLRDVTSNHLKERGQKSWVWDATTLPTNSHYVPVFLKILADLEHEESLAPDTHILVETTTGNAGSAIAYLARELGYPVVIFMPEDMPTARIEDVRAYLSAESELRLTSKGRYVQGVVSALRDFVIEHKDSGYRGRRLCVVNHSRRAVSSEVIENCVFRLLQNLPMQATIDTAVVALGNGTTATGIARAVRNINPIASVVGVEPIESPWFYVQKYGEDRFRQQFFSKPGPHPHRLIGTGGWGVRFPNLDLGLVDDIILVTEDEWRGQLAALRGRGLGVGHSSAACQSIVERLAMLHDDRIENYFSMFYDPISKYEKTT